VLHVRECATETLSSPVCDFSEFVEVEPGNDFEVMVSMAQAAVDWVCIENVDGNICWYFSIFT